MLFSLFDNRGFGLEVGGSYGALVRKSLGFNVETFDHADADTLRQKYKNIDSPIEDVTYVSDGRGLFDIIGKPDRYDFIVASHVIEHVTDIVRFLQDCSALLKPSGVLVLAVPDKRYCFDVLRPVSTVGQALQAYAEKRTRHSPGVIYDSLATTCMKSNEIVWREPTLDDIALSHDPEGAHSFFEAVLKTDDYNDTHGWMFTPSYFRYFIKTLRSLGYFQLGEKEFHMNSGTDRPMHEFYMTLSKRAPALNVTDLDLLKASHVELAEIAISRQRQVDIGAITAELSRVTAERDALLRSASWKITAPLRKLKMAFSQ
ncbi:methyltransferase domain-containing protein [Mesorhizobium sp.]|uniref:class I SAM-dependent methyltransferase n=1 Tax=Mesorhizobium sp. TaxID=1871066 RepID=UPI0025E82BBF|nr:methyltransferase domain-containing protein [Mesorhizobium sp.]